MITLTSGSDTLIQLEFCDVDINTITSLEIDYYTDIINKVTLSDQNGGIIMYDGYLCAKIESAQTTAFKGLLKCDVRIGWSNSAFDDATQNMIAKQILPIKFI